MALTKQITTDTGVTASYWSITEWTMDKANTCCNFIIGCFIDKPMRVAGKQPVRISAYSVQVTDFSSDPRPACYDYLKESAVEFSDATDA